MDLRLTFEDVYNEVSTFIGWGSSPTGTDLTNAKNVVYRAYRKFLNPVDPRTGKRHTWSFLRQSSVLVTESGKWVYSAPEDFGRMKTRFKYSSDDGYAPLRFVTEGTIIHKRNLSEYESHPHLFSIRNTTYTKQTGQGKEFLFYGTPDGVYRLNYSYLINPVKPTSADDYFVGNAESDEVLLQMSLAQAEQFWMEKFEIQSQLADDALNKLILADDDLTADTLGFNTDKKARSDFIRNLPTIPEDEIYQ